MNIYEEFVFLNGDRRARKTLFLTVPDSMLSLKLEWLFCNHLLHHTS